MPRPLCFLFRIRISLEHHNSPALVSLTVRVRVGGEGREIQVAGRFRAPKYEVKVKCLVCPTQTQKINTRKHEKRMSQRSQGKVRIFEEFPLRRANKHASTTFKMVMSMKEKKVNN